MALLSIVDTKAMPANRGKAPAMDALLWLLERFDALVAEARTDGVVVCGVPPGGRGEESTFLARCIDELAAGTDHVQFERLALPVFTAQSHPCLGAPPPPVSPLSRNRGIEGRLG